MNKAGSFGSLPTLRRIVPRLGAVLGVALAGIVTGGCQQSPDIRYRVTVSVLDDGVVRSGSGVWGFTLTRGLQGGYDPQVRGNAVAVDLGSRGRLFALLAGRSISGLPTSYDDMGLLPEALFGDIALGRAGELPLHKSRIDDLRAIKKNIGAVRVLPCFEPSKYADHCPFMVRFRDLADVTSVQPVDPANLAEAFGAGISLKEVTVEITEDPLTQSNTAALPDYSKTPGFAQWFSTLSINDPRRIGPENFRQGDKR